jgi:hypothetical protein
MKKRSLGRHFGQAEMNDPLIRSQLKNFLDQQIQEKHLKKLEERNENTKQGLSMFEPNSENMIKEI